MNDENHAAPVPEGDSGESNPALPSPNTADRRSPDDMPPGIGDPEERALYRELMNLEPGLRTNRALFEILLKPRLLGYWTFLEPGTKNLEVADVLVLFGDVAILVQAKTRAVAREPSPVWVQEAIADAIKQVNDRVADLRSGRIKTVSNEWRGELPWDPARIKHYYGLVVLAPTMPPLNPLELVPDEFAQSQVPVQVITLFDLAEVLRLFDTAYDLIVYYEVRLEYMRRNPLLLANEQEALFSIIGIWDQLWKGDPSEGRKLQEYLLSLGNAVYQTKLATTEGGELWAASKLIDLALRPIEEAAPVGSDGRPVPDEGHALRVRVTEAMAEMSRNRRSFYGKRWVEAADEALATVHVSVRTSHSPSRSRSYALIATPLGDDPSEEQVAEIAVATLREKGTNSCLALAASAESIRMNFESLLHTAMRREKTELAGALVLAPKIAFIEPR